MPNILIRNLDEDTIKQLKERAAENGRSLQAEAKYIVERSIREKTFDQLRQEAEKFSRRFIGRKMSDTVELLREDRER
jgi:plasmid stability protein